MASTNLPPRPGFEVNESRHPVARHEFANSVLAIGILTILLFGPLAFGYVHFWAIFILEAGTAALLLLWTWTRVAETEVRVLTNPLFGPMAAFAAVIAIQIIFGLSAYRYATISKALLYCAYAALCFLTAQCKLRKIEVKHLAVVISAYGFAIALFAVLQSLSPNGKVYWFFQPEAGGWIYGPYINHNHYAGLMEILTPVPLVLGLTKGIHGTKKAIFLFAAMLMASTIFLSGSRGGMVAFATQIMFLAAVLSFQKDRRSGVIAASLIAIIFAFLIWVGGRSTTERVASIRHEAEEGLSGSLRLNINRDGMKMFAQKPLLGWGLGTFPVVYPQFRSFFSDKFINEAHNDYLQLLVETGGAGFLVMLWFLALVYRDGMRKIKNWTRDPDGAIALACLLACTGILVHSFVDFNLQIPANAALFYVLCTLACSPMQPAISPGNLGKKPRSVSAKAFGKDVDCPQT